VLASSQLPVVLAPTVKKAIHLLYVPTMFCNMSCQYCYLGELTEEKLNTEQAVATLDTALGKLLGAGYLPFHLSFHGGEVTTLPTQVLDQLFQIAADHYAAHAETIKAQGFRLSPLHIKTNLLNFAKHHDTFIKHQVSISASVDLPFSLHEAYRRDKNGNSTLERILSNLKQLASYPHHKKISCVVTAQHLEQLDSFIADLRFLHYDLGLDMSRFNVMFGFDAPRSADKFGQHPAGTEMLSGPQQVEFYRRIKAAFTGTPLEAALRSDWFKEFTPDYCCSAVNCGDKFFLLQADGDVYACPRGQSSPSYRYGNIFQDEIEEIIANGWKVIERNENRLEPDPACLRCAYLPYCNLGCTFVRQEAGLRKSYTCELQQALYRDDPERYPPYRPADIEAHSRHWLLRNNLQQLSVSPHKDKSRFVTPELYQAEHSLPALIQADPILQALYAEDLFFLVVDGVRYPLRSPLLKNEADLEVLGPHSTVWLGVREDAFALDCEYPVNNHVLLMLLRDTPVVYGDEQRRKQAHIFDYALYRDTFIAGAQSEAGYWLRDISAILTLHAPAYLDGVRNNLFFTTRTLREYHYTKQRKNAFYHLQAVNLPFQNIEFIWQD